MPVRHPLIALLKSLYDFCRFHKNLELVDNFIQTRAKSLYSLSECK